MAIDVHIIDDHAMVREGLRLLLGSAGDLVFVGESATAPTALDALEKRAPDVRLELELGEDEGVDLPSTASWA